MASRTLSRRSRRASDDMPSEEQFDSRYDDEEDDPEPPRRGRARGRSRDADEDERPRRGSRSRRSRDDDDEDERPRRSSRSEGRSRSRSRDDDEDRPRRRSGGRSGGNTGQGWKAFKQKREERSDFVKNYKYHEEEALIKILDEEPFSVFAEHWLDELSGKKSFVCLGDDCPLCDVGDRPRIYAMFNILDLSDPDDVKVSPWKVSQTTTDVLENFASSSKTSPINRDDLYWSVWKSGGGKAGRVQIHVSPVKARDLEEDWDIEPFSEEELDDFERFSEEDVVQFSSRKELSNIADDLD